MWTKGDRCLDAYLAPLGPAQFFVVSAIEPPSDAMDEEVNQFFDQVRSWRRGPSEQSKC